MIDAESLLKHIKECLADGREDLAKEAITQYGITRFEDGKIVQGWKGTRI